MSEACKGVPLAGGLDGCPAGWLLASVALDEDGLALIGAMVYADFGQVLEATQGYAALAVDMPIGLSDNSRRAADVLARRAIGPRASSVFPSPVRAVLKAKTYGEANLISESRHELGKRISKQTWLLTPKIREVDALMTPALQSRVVESHPEVCFWALNEGRYLHWPKRSAEGRADRLDLLAGVYGDLIRDLRPPHGSDWDDLYDACVLARTASRLAAGVAERLPPEPQCDGRGLRMEIVY